MDANLALLGLADLLDFSLSLDDVAAGKPDPEPYRAAAERLGIPPRRMAAIEDSPSGLASARAAGCFAVGLCGDPGRLAGTGADAVGPPGSTTFPPFSIGAGRSALQGGQ